MAIASTEKLRGSINVEPLLKKIKIIVGISEKETHEVVPWANRWNGKFSEDVLYGTTGLYLKYRASSELLGTHPKTEAAKVWYKQARRDFLNYLHSTPQSQDVYESLHQSNLFTVGPKETLAERSLRSLIGGINRLLKGGA